MCSVPGWPVGLMPVSTTSMAVRCRLRAALVAEWSHAAAEADVLELNPQVVGVGRVDLRDAVARPRFRRQPLRFERGDRRRRIEVGDAETNVIDVRRRGLAALIDAQERVADGEVDAALLRALDVEAERALIEGYGT